MDKIKIETQDNVCDDLCVNYEQLADSLKKENEELKKHFEELTRLYKQNKEELKTLTRAAKLLSTVVYNIQAQIDLVKTFIKEEGE